MELFNHPFKGLDWASKTPDIDITIGGLGSIGSWLSILLARTGIKSMQVFEYDTLEDRNIGGSLHPVDNIGMNKVTSTNKEMIRLCSYQTYLFDYGKLEEGSVVNSGIVFSGFDNMTARKILFDKWKNLENPLLFIDGRLQLEDFQVFAVTPDRIKDYQKTLFNDGEIEEVACSLKNTSHSAAMCASIMTSLFVNFVDNHFNNADREIPFKTEINLSLFNYEITTHKPIHTKQEVIS